MVESHLSFGSSREASLLPSIMHRLPFSISDRSVRVQLSLPVTMEEIMTFRKYIFVYCNLCIQWNSDSLWQWDW